MKWTTKSNAVVSGLERRSIPLGVFMVLAGILLTFFLAIKSTRTLPHERGALFLAVTTWNT